MIKRDTSNHIIYALTAALCLLALGSMDHLSWREHARLLLILVGLVVLYIRYRTALRACLVGEDQPDSGSLLYGAGVVVALSAMFVVTQYDPATSSITLRSVQPRFNWFFWLSTVLAAGMGACFVVSRLRELRLRDLRLIDRIFSGVVLAVVADDGGGGRRRDIVARGHLGDVARIDLQQQRQLLGGRADTKASTHREA